MRFTRDSRNAGSAGVKFCRISETDDDFSACRKRQQRAAKIDKPSTRSNNSRVTASAHRFRLEYGGQLVELSVQRDGLRTQVALFVDGDQVGDASGLGRVLTPLPVAAPIAACSTGKPDAGVSDAMVANLRGPRCWCSVCCPGR
jgi:hypothetical protein